MMRYALILLFVYVAWRILVAPKRAPQNKQPKTPLLDEETLVACKTCGTFFKPSLGHFANNQHYCQKKCLP